MFYYRGSSFDFLADLIVVLIESDVELEAIVRPGPELHHARLDVERKVGDVDRASTFKNGLRDPEDGTIAAHHHHRLSMFLQASIGAVNIIQNSIRGGDGVLRCPGHQSSPVPLYATVLYNRLLIHKWYIPHMLTIIV